MQNVITSTSPLDGSMVVSDIKGGNSSYTDDDGLVKRKQDSVVISPVEKNLKHPTHQSYHIEEVL